MTPRPADPLTATLRHLRQGQRLSQLELSLRLGVSQRHVSFVETGRARPSRTLLIAWLQALEAPLALRNQALLQAGYAPVYRTTDLEDPALTSVNTALDHLLAAHDPLPALVIDAQWNLLRWNRGGQWLATTLLPWATGLTDPVGVNLLDLLNHPQGLAQSILNLDEVGPAILTLLRHEADVHPELAPRVETFAAFVKARIGTSPIDTHGRPATAPVLTTRYATPWGELAFFSMFTTFGTPQDITLTSLRVEHLFPADAATKQCLQEQVQL